jgi:hypothetical protein
MELVGLRKAGKAGDDAEEEAAAPAKKRKGKARANDDDEEDDQDDEDGANGKGRKKGQSPTLASHHPGSIVMLTLYFCMLARP